MIDKKAKEKKLTDEFQPQLESYWAKVTFDDIVSIRTKDIKTHYLSRESEQFMALRLGSREIPGVGPRDLRIIRLDQDSPEISTIPESWVDTIDGKSYTAPTEWVVTGSRGSEYKVNRTGQMYKCTCPAFKYRKGDCKHIKGVKNDNTV